MIGEYPALVSEMPRLFGALDADETVDVSAIAVRRRAAPANSSQGLMDTP